MVYLTLRKDKESLVYYISVKDFVDAFQFFHMSANLKTDCSVPYNKSECHTLALPKEKYGSSKTYNFSAWFDRQVLFIKRNAFALLMTQNYHSTL